MSRVAAAVLCVAIVVEATAALTPLGAASTLRLSDALRRAGSVTLLVSAPVAPPACPALRPNPSFGVALIDVGTGQTLCARNPDGTAQPASTTKIMATLLTAQYLQVHRLSLETPIVAQAIDTQVEWDAAVAYLQVGQSYSVRDLLSLAAIPSAADAVVALARFVAGSRAAFVDLMNSEAQLLGMRQTHFSSPYSYASVSQDRWWEGESMAVGNYPSAEDLALLMTAFVQYPDLVAIFGATTYADGRMPTAVSR
jgi:D-alanyl-D-alanine carboxypeptidase (penicillin-binding protein 5/6)